MLQGKTLIQKVTEDGITLWNLWRFNVINDDTTIFIHVEDEKADTEYTVIGKMFDDNIGHYSHEYCECLRIYAAKNQVYLNLYR